MNTFGLWESTPSADWKESNQNYFIYSRGQKFTQY